MKFFHLGDLHLGKKLLGESLLEDQKFILDQILTETENEHPRGILLAGDIYDKSIPSGEAVVLFDSFLNRLVGAGLEIFIISGNHDSPERLEFARNLLEKNHIHITGSFQGKLSNTVLSDEWGELVVWQMPFVKPALLKPYFETSPETYEEAVQAVLETGRVDRTKRNILIAHQYVISQGEKPLSSDSEQLSLGGLDQVDAACFDAFDYVALGHIHRPQKIGRLEVRYAGSPLKYSFSEVQHKKAITVVDIEEKGQVSLRKIPLYPLHEMAVIRGTMEELRGEAYRKYRSGYYLSAVLTDEEPVENPLEKLREYFPGLLEFSVDNARTRERKENGLDTEEILAKSPGELFREFYKKQNHVELSENEEILLEEVLRKVGENEV